MSNDSSPKLPKSSSTAESIAAPMRKLEFILGDEAELEARSKDFRNLMLQRRTVRNFVPTSVPE